jgi:hypothetical protein
VLKTVLKIAFGTIRWKNEDQLDITDLESKGIHSEQRESLEAMGIPDWEIVSVLGFTSSDLTCQSVFRDRISFHSLPAVGGPPTLHFRSFLVVRRSDVIVNRAIFQ